MNSNAEGRLCSVAAVVFTVALCRAGHSGVFFHYFSEYYQSDANMSLVYSFPNIFLEIGNNISITALGIKYRVTYFFACYLQAVFQLHILYIPYPTAFPYGNGMVLHFYQQQESSTTKTVHRVINRGPKTYVYSPHTGENFH